MIQILNVVLLERTVNALKKKSQNNSNKELEADQEELVDLVKEFQMKWVTESV